MDSDVDETNYLANGDDANHTKHIDFCCTFFIPGFVAIIVLATKSLGTKHEKDG